LLSFVRLDEKSPSAERGVYDEPCDPDHRDRLRAAAAEVGDANPKEYTVKCSIVGCPGEYEATEVVRAVRQEDRIIVVEHIPAEVCSVCGDVLFTPATIERLEALRKSDAPTARTVPLYEFAGSTKG
jgi:YgiT-type zinc finger domain-containing protein